MIDKYSRRKTYLSAHPETTWGNVEYRNDLYDAGYDLCAIKPNGVMVFRKRNIFVRMWRAL